MSRFHAMKIVIGIRLTASVIVAVSVAEIGNDEARKRELPQERLAGDERGERQ